MVAAENVLELAGFRVDREEGHAGVGQWRASPQLIVRPRSLPPAK